METKPSQRKFNLSNNFLLQAKEVATKLENFEKNVK
jgi:hypothetical protein